MIKAVHQKSDEGKVSPGATCEGLCTELLEHLYTGIYLPIACYQSKCDKTAGTANGELESDSIWRQEC
jgi:hypothetical protein